ncbi:MAG: N-methylhydantoinase [Gaiellaceae bacterium]|nr:N-methylhydantoinase [Gaiellaceae bacterium]
MAGQVQEPVTYRPPGATAKQGSATTEDPITTEVIRHGLNAAADQMQLALCRTAFSPIIYEILDLCCALYDRDVRLLAQGKSLPSWLGTMNFSIEAIVKAVGGPETLEEGDVLFSTYGYDLGSHPQDAVTVLPIFFEGELVGYAAVKAHQMDIGAKDLYCSDTTDNFQEGAIFPGVRLYRKGELQEDLWRSLIANSRMPKALAGDVHASIASAEVGARSVRQLLERYGTELFFSCVERMFDHGEATVRRFLEEIPDGRYVARGALDSNGITTDSIDFEITIDVQGSEILVDFSDAPPQQRGPVNAPQPVAVSCARYTMMFLAGGGSRDYINEGHLRPIAVRTRPGTMFHPLPPAPLFLYNHPSRQACDAIIRAMADALPGQVTADSGGCICSALFWGTKEDGTLWGTGIDHAVGQGATLAADGGGPLMHIAVSGIRSTPVEVAEARFPLVVRKFELAQDSSGAGQHRGGLGLDVEYELLEDVYCTAIIERTKREPLGLFGGDSARANRMGVRDPEGGELAITKVTALPIVKGSIFQVRTGGGGGYGPAAERSPEQVARDVREGFISEEQARADYPHAFGAKA